MTTSAMTVPQPAADKQNELAGLRAEIDQLRAERSGSGGDPRLTDSNR